MFTRIRALLNGYTNVKPANNSNSSILEESNEKVITANWEREAIEGTPFTVVGTEKEYYLLMGKYRLSEKMKSAGMVKQWLKENQWTVIMQLILIITDEKKK